MLSQSVANEHVGFVTLIDKILHSLNNKHVYILKFSFSLIKEMGRPLFYFFFWVKKQKVFHLSFPLLIDKIMLNKCNVDPPVHQTGMIIIMRQCFTLLNQINQKAMLIMYLDRI